MGLCLYKHQNQQTTTLSEDIQIDCDASSIQQDQKIDSVRMNHFFTVLTEFNSQKNQIFQLQKNSQELQSNSLFFNKSQPEINFGQKNENKQRNKQFSDSKDNEEDSQSCNIRTENTKYDNSIESKRHTIIPFKVSQPIQRQNRFLLNQPDNQLSFQVFSPNSDKKTSKEKQISIKSILKSATAKCSTKTQQQSIQIDKELSKNLGVQVSQKSKRKIHFAYGTKFITKNKQSTEVNLYQPAPYLLTDHNFIGSGYFKRKN